MLFPQNSSEKGESQSGTQALRKFCHHHAIYMIMLCFPYLCVMLCSLRKAADFLALFLLVGWEGGVGSACLFKMFSALILKQSYLVCTASLSQSKWQILYDCIQVEFNSLGTKVFLVLCITKNTMAPLYKLWQIGNIGNSKRKRQEMVQFIMRHKVTK